MRCLALFTCIFRSNIRNKTKLCMHINIGYVVILPFNGFHLRSNKCGICINMFLKTLINKKYSSKHIEMLFLLYILYIREFKNKCGIKFIKLIIVLNILNLFFLLFMNKKSSSFTHQIERKTKVL